MATLPTFERFTVHGEETTAGTRWSKWLAKLENILVALDITSDARKKALLIHYGGDDVFEIVHSMTDEKKGVGATKNIGTDTNPEIVPNAYEVIKQSLTDYFTPKKNTAYETFKFRQTSQKEDENIDAFHIRLRSAAALCEFHDVDKEILGQIIQGCTSSRVRRKALKDNLNLQQVLDDARSLELSESRATAIEGACRAIAREASACAVDDVPRDSPAYAINNDVPAYAIHHGRRSNRGRARLRGSNNQNNPSWQQRPGYNHSTPIARPGGTSSGYRAPDHPCYYCGSTNSHPKNSCPAKDKRCAACQKVGHYAAVCRSKPSVRQIDFDSCSDSDEFVFSVANPDTQSPKFTAHLLDTPTDFLIDTGASVNIVNKATYMSLPNRPILMTPCPRIFAYDSARPLSILGSFQGEIKFNNEVVDKATFYVMESASCRNLLCNHTAQSLNLIHFALSSQPAKIPDEFPALFDGQLGKIKNVQIKLHVDRDVQPVAQRHRRIPFHVRQDVETELQRLEDLDIIEKVHGPTPWTSPIVVVPKKSSSSGSVRVCIDMRAANKAIGREKHPMPTIDDLIADMNGSKYFSKLDMTNAYHQLELEESSRYITTFTTHVGLRRYKRLLFGVNAASEIFQNAISSLLHDIPGVRNLSDDIIIHGKTQAAHDQTLQATLQRLNDNGAKLNKEKCVFSTQELIFFGHVFNAKGVSVDPEKVKAIVDMEAPKNVNEVRSFLGMTQYVSRFIHGYSGLTEPLRKLTKSDVPWQWTKHEQQAFENLKHALTGCRVMAYFDASQHTEVIVDASPIGIGAILTQNGRVICYASRALTGVEQRYSQIDREMLAVVFGVEHFHLYLFGANFTVITDHKPLLGIIKSQKPASTRMERWRLRLMPYEITLKYRPGRDDLNPADYASRHPQTTPIRDNAAEAYIHYVCRNAVPKTMTLREVETATQEDPELRRLMQAIQTGNWTSGVGDYVKVKEELSVSCGVILRGHRLVLPSSLRQKVIDISHSSHQGIVKTKQLIREKVWFPHIDRMVEETVKSCIPCLSAVSTPVRREPINMTPLPTSPWSEICVDFAGPFPSGDYALVVIDEYSRYPEVDIITSTSAKAVIPRLDTIFARHGIPHSVKTDNGPPFNSADFTEFANTFGFRHRKITPLWPEANGEAERFMRTLNKHVRSSSSQGENWKRQLAQFLRHYRATPHSSTKVSPFEALTGRKMKFGLPELPSSPVHPPPLVTSKMALNDATSKAKMKAYGDQKRHAAPSTLSPGDPVLVKQPKANKTTPPFDPKPYTVVQTKGSMITAQRGPSSIVRNSSHFKMIPNYNPADEDDAEQSADESDGAEGEPITNTSADATPAPRFESTPATPTNAGPVSSYPESTGLTPLRVSRPTRARRLPLHLEDYVMCNQDHA